MADETKILRVVLTVDGTQFDSSLTSYEVRARQFASTISGLNPVMKVLVQDIAATATLSAEAQAQLLEVAQAVKAVQAGVGQLDERLTMTNELLGFMSALAAGSAAGLNQMAAAGNAASSSVSNTNTTLTLFKQIAGALGLGLTAAGMVELAKATIDTGMQYERLHLQLAAVTGGTGSAAQAEAYLLQESIRLGISLTTLTKNYADLVASTNGTALAGEKTREIFSAVAEASAKLNLNTEQTNGVFLALEQMASKGTVQMQELKLQLGNDLPGAFEIAARAMGMSTAQLNEFMSKGDLLASDFLPRFGEELRKEFGTDSTTRIDTTQASFSRLGTEIRLLAKDIADGLTPALAAAANAASSYLDYVRRTRNNETLGRADAGLALTPFADPFSPGAAAAMVDAATGGLSARPGVPALSIEQAGPQDAKGQERLARLKQEYEQLTLAQDENKNSLLALYRVMEGDLKDADTQTKNWALMIARLKDQQAAEKEAQQAADDAARTAEQAAQRQAQQRAEAQRMESGLLASVQARISAAQQELGSTEKLTEADREMAKVRAGEYDIRLQALGLSDKELEAFKAQLMTQLQIEGSLERQVAAQQKVQQVVQMADRVGKRDSVAEIRRTANGGTAAQSYLQQDIATEDETTRYRAEMDEFRRQLQQKILTQAQFDRAAEAAARVHEAQMNAIEEAGAESRKRIQERSAAFEQEVMQQRFSAAQTAADIFTMLAGKSRDAQIASLALNTIIAEAEIFANTQIAATRALAELGPIAGPPMAATIESWGLTQMALVAAKGVIQGAMIAGGREAGGPVLAGGLYQVGERGKPELLEQDGNYYLLPGDRSGTVSPASRAGGTAPQVNVHVHGAPSQPQVQATTGADGALNIKLLFDQFDRMHAKGIRDGTSSTAKALSATYPLKRKAST